jgi:hypothetical protein
MATPNAWENTASQNTVNLPQMLLKNPKKEKINETFMSQQQFTKVI